MITCSLLFDRHCGSGEIIFPKRWGQTKLRDGRRAQGTNGRVPFVIIDGSDPNRGYPLLFPSSEALCFAGSRNVVIRNRTSCRSAGGLGREDHAARRLAWEPLSAMPHSHRQTAHRRHDGDLFLLGILGDDSAVRLLLL